MRLSPMKKSASERLDFDIQFSNWLASGDTIIDAQAVIDSVNTGLSVDEVQIFTPIVKVWLSGGEVFKNYDVKVIVTTQSGRIAEVVFNLRIVEF